MTGSLGARIGASCLGALLVLGAAGSAAATTTAEAAGNASNVSTADGQIELVFEATGTDAAIDPDSVTLLLNDQELDADAAPVDEGSGSIGRTSMLVMDTSGSMNENGRLADAKQAARAFIESLPADVRAGLVTFDDTARVVRQPTADRVALLASVNGLQANGSTAIYDGVRLAARELGRDGVRSIVLMTDGEEEGSNSTQREATTAVRARDIHLDAVAFQSTAGLDTLNALADAGKGQVFQSADVAELTSQFQAAAERISRQLLVTAPIPDDAPTGQVTLTVSGDAEGELVTATALGLIAASPSATPTINAAPKASALPDDPWMNNWFIWVAVALFFLGLAGVFAFAFNAAVPTKKAGITKQLSVYTLNRGKAKEQRRERTVFGESAVAHTAVDFAGRITAKRGLEERLQRRLDAAAVPLKPAEWILVQAGILLLLPLLAFLISGRSVVITLVAIAVAAVGPFMFLSVKESRRRKSFVDSLPDTLQLMAGSLSAGYSLPQAVDSVVRDGQDPIATEFNRALVETRLGVPIEDALETIADRMRSKDWAWVVMAIRVQREVGGNLAELLLTVAATLRERARIRRQIQTLSAEGRLSAYILGGLPIVFTLYLLVARPDYILTLTEEPLGWLMIISGVVIMTVGGLWMKKIVDVEV
jgi:tight adherence protein B